ncbi:MAG TPA: hypothetical protein VFI35_08850 [Actinomycetota bacterium]|nr:hypothetical protein [Actinomycetota bacterium]
MAIARRDLAWLGGLWCVLLAVFVWPYAIDGHPFGVGPDVPVYLWWTRVGASEGLSMVGSRPGAPALVAALVGTLHLNVTAVTAGLASALGVAVGAASAALVRRAAERTWLLAGLLAGVFSVHLVAGYLANLVVAVAFLAAAACLAGPRRSWWAAAVLLAGGGLAHGPFLVHAIVVFAGAAALAWRAGARDEARDIALSVTAGGVVAAAGILATIAGPGPIAAETSRDGYLRRAGLDRQLVDAYRERFRLRAARYVQWISVPLAVAGTAVADASVEGGFLRRFLASWLTVIAVGVPVGYITGWLPPDRLVTFGFAVPIAAAIGLGWLRGRLGGRGWLTWAVVGALAGWMILGGLLAWGRQAPFVNPREVELAREAGLRVGPPTDRRPIVYIVDDADATATFLGSRAANILRAAISPERAADVYVFVGTISDFFDDRPTVRGDPEYDALSRLTLADIPNDPEPLVVVLGPFYRGNVSSSELLELGPSFWATESLPEFSMTRPGPLDFIPSSGAWISIAALAILVMLSILGLGYAGAAFEDPVVAIATAPAFGAAAVTLAATALDRMGLRLESTPVALAASVLASLGGLAAFLVVQRQRDREAPA